MLRDQCCAIQARVRLCGAGGGRRAGLLDAADYTVKGTKKTRLATVDAKCRLSAFRLPVTGNRKALKRLVIRVALLIYSP